MEKRFQEDMTGVMLKGFFTVGDSGETHDDAYQIEKVTKVGPNYVSVEIAPSVEVQVEKSGISRLVPKGTIKDAQ